ncbi:MAG: hypothetical protein LKG27_05375 [Clostridiaceae bacterium]|jgi:hypothetical protein|nr:hypothetical protein [Clostridiaceae bacterium]
MKRKARIIQISGFRGILLVIFIATCLAAGFIGFPAIIAMYSWNYIANVFTLPHINVFQGILLWGFIAGSIYLMNDKKKFISAFQVQSPKELSDEDLKAVLERARIQAQAKILNSMTLKAKDLKDIKFESAKSTNPINNDVADNDKESLQQHNTDKIEK